MFGFKSLNLVLYKLRSLVKIESLFCLETRLTLSWLYTRKTKQTSWESLAAPQTNTNQEFCLARSTPALVLWCKLKFLLCYINKIKYSFKFWKTHCFMFLIRNPTQRKTKTTGATPNWIRTKTVRCCSLNPFFKSMTMWFTAGGHWPSWAGRCSFEKDETNPTGANRSHVWGTHARGSGHKVRKKGSTGVPIS